MKEGQMSDAVPIEGLFPGAEYVPPGDDLEGLRDRYKVERENAYEQLRIMEQQSQLLRIRIARFEGAEEAIKLLIAEQQQRELKNPGAP